MAIRDCALQSKAFQALKGHWEDRDRTALEWKKQGKKVIGELGCDVPDELVIAAGMLPVRIYADPRKPLVETDRYLEYSFEPMVRAQFERIIDGTYTRLCDEVVISNSTDIVIRVFLYLRELHRTEPERDFPPVYFIDWLFTRKEAYAEHNEFTLDLFRKELEKLRGAEITDDEIRAAGRICNDNRAALREMAELRHGKEVRISGSEAQVIIGAGFFMEKEEHTRLVKQVVEDAKNWPVLDGPRVFYTGANQEDTGLYEKMEAAGLAVVGEDTDWGDRSYWRDYQADYTPIRAVVDRYMLREYSAKKATPQQRTEALDREVDAASAEAVVFYTNKYDEVACWDMPMQRKSLESRGIKHTTFGQMKWPLDANEGLDEQLAQLAAELKGGVQ